ncbi:MAG: quinone-dependent dihydroorotate dehydrogenase [Rhodobacteraceae bacterium]|nr:quinone-dependent dihydroorotate dehydrogenase [Paracoccaceae bacterium]
MRLVDRASLALFHKLDPEHAHGLAIRALQTGVVPKARYRPSPRLATSIGPIGLASPVGLAAGFDKNAEAVNALAGCGFGWLEVGAATPRPQPGNPKPRLFRLSEDRAAINRFGFNNEGMETIAQRLAGYQGSVPLGLNLGANKDSGDRAADYVTVFKHCAPHVDFATVNISSPNTERLRDLQGADALRALLGGVVDARAALKDPRPVFLKIAPDLSEHELEDIARIAAEAGIDAIIATNTTLAREGLSSKHAPEKGGLSGAPLMEKSTRVLARLSTLTDLHLIGVGGVASAEDAYAKIKAGACAVQLYTALIYGGIGLVDEITKGLDALLARDGHISIAGAIGSDRDRWLG